MDNRTFGEFLTENRKNNGITLRGFASIIGLSPVYICDIEKDRRPAPAQPLLDKIIEILKLSNEDKLLAYDLAGKSKNTVPVDLPQYIVERDIVKTALRKAKEVDATDEEWQEFIDKLSRRKK